MVENKYNINIPNDTVIKNLHRLLNQTYKLLPMREEGADWEKPLETIIEEIVGMNEILFNDIFFSLLCKLEGLKILKNKEDFPLYRRTIFECLSMIGELKKCLLKA